jgi:phage gpG-like protein
MTREDIIAAIDEEITRLEKVRALLRDTTGAKFLTNSVSTSRKKRNLSAEARKRIADAQKRRWAKQKKQSSGSSAK